MMASEIPAQLLADVRELAGALQGFSCEACGWIVGEGDPEYMPGDPEPEPCSSCRPIIEALGRVSDQLPEGE